MNSDVEAMLSIAKDGYESQGENFEVFKAQARTVFGASSIILSLVSVLRIFSSIPEGEKLWYMYIIAGIVVLYILLVVISLILLSPVKWNSPVLLEWEELQSTFLGKNSRDLILAQIGAYLNAKDLNQLNVRKRYCLTIAQSIIFAIIIVLVIIAGLILHM